jgi:hypothetical protein
MNPGKRFFSQGLRNSVTSNAPPEPPLKFRFDAIATYQSFTGKAIVADWSPDGTVKPDGTDDLRLIDFPANDGHAVWTQDGKHILRNIGEYDSKIKRRCTTIRSSRMAPSGS